MLWGEWWVWRIVLGCSKTLPPLPPLPAPLNLPPSPLLSWKVRALPLHSNSPLWLAALCCPSSPPLPHTFALRLAPSSPRHTPTSGCFGREKAFWIPARQSIAAEVCVFEWAEQRGVIAASGRYDNKMPAQHSVYKLAIIESIVNPLYSTRVYKLELTVPRPYTHDLKKQSV